MISYPKCAIIAGATCIGLFIHLTVRNKAVSEKDLKVSDQTIESGQSSPNYNPDNLDVDPYDSAAMQLMLHILNAYIEDEDLIFEDDSLYAAVDVVGLVLKDLYVLQMPVDDFYQTFEDVLNRELAITLKALFEISLIENEILALETLGEVVSTHYRATLQALDNNL